MGEHTPGPWAISNRDEILGHPDQDGDDVVIAVVGKSSGFRNSPHTVVRNPADRHLIAAAPDLLEALKKCRNEIALIRDALDHNNLSVDGWHLNGDLEPIQNFWADIPDDGLNSADAAIAKATGQADA